MRVLLNGINAISAGGSSVVRNIVEKLPVKSNEGAGAFAYSSTPSKLTDLVKKDATDSPDNISPDEGVLDELSKLRHVQHPAFIC